jgi:hypothetical protein
VQKMAEGLVQAVKQGLNLKFQYWQKKPKKQKNTVPTVSVIRSGYSQQLQLTSLHL